MAKRILYIECIKIKIAESNNFMEIRMGGGEGEGVFELGNPEGRGAHAVSEFQVEGGSKKHAFCHEGVDFFWNNPKQTYMYLRTSLLSNHYSLLFSWREVPTGNRSAFAGYQSILPFRKN